MENQQPQTQTPQAKILAIVDQIKAKIPAPVMEALQKFYAKKIFFWPVTISFGLMFVVIILGLLFGGRKPTQVVFTQTKPTPLIQNLPQQTPISDGLTEIEQKLTNLKTRIDNLDVKQSRLAPPDIDFNISF